VSDIFNAILDGAQSVMLTGETAVGRYPVEAMSYLIKTSEEALLYQSGKEELLWD
jgi:pyruvate kinase